MAWRRVVADEGACKLPGVSIKFDVLAPKVERAVDLGFVKREHADYVLNGLRFGFDLGIDTSVLKGKIGFRNYPSALSARAQISKSVRARVGACKTLCLGKYDTALKREMCALWDSWRIFPLGGVPKPLEPDSIRLISSIILGQALSWLLIGIFLLIHLLRTRR